eukprot:2215527-Prymnesium_polylepis.1
MSVSWARRCVSETSCPIVAAMAAAEAEAAAPTGAASGRALSATASGRALSELASSVCVDKVAVPPTAMCFPLAAGADAAAGGPSIFLMTTLAMALLACYFQRKAKKAKKAAKKAAKEAKGAEGEQETK